jgi:cytochrome c oxidase assembly protein subunit 11
MPVLFYVDPSIRNEPSAAAVEQITLSYTFHRARDSG